MAGWGSKGQTRMPATGAIIVVLVLMTLTAFTSADFPPSPTSLLGRRKFTIKNIFPFDGTPPCSQANNTVAFFPNSTNPLKGTVKIVGEFDGAGIGVCTDSFYAVTPGVVIPYYIYGDLVIYRVPGRVASVSKFVFQQGKLSAVLIAQDFYASELTDVGYAGYSP